MPSLKIRRMRYLAIQVFKIINKQSPIYLHDLVNVKNIKYTFRYKNLLEVPRIRTTRYGLHTLRYAAPNIWNKLPNDFRVSMSLNEFRGVIGKWEGDSCKCSFCK